MTGLTIGFTGADLKNLVNQAGQIAIESNWPRISQSHLDEAFDKILVGLDRKSLLQSQEERLKVAYHEAGHTIMSLLTKSEMEVHSVTILPRGSSLGHTGFVMKNDKKFSSKSEFHGNILISLGGRAAEELIYGSQHITTGCGSDLIKAT